MSVAQLQPDIAAAPALRVVEQADRAVYWLYMHAHLARAPGRACFVPRLIDELIAFQQALRIRLRDRAVQAHVVLASDADVFNLGGDLDLFCQLIRGVDRESLLHYARRCVQAAHAFHDGLGIDAHTIALVQGAALGGGFEAALSSHTIVAEEGATMGLPEVLFDLFPGMGAYSLLCQRTSPRVAERLMLDGNVYDAREALRMGLVDVVVPRGQGPQAVEEIIRESRRIPHARSAMRRVRDIAQPVTLAEMMRITEIWVDTALQLGEKSLRTMGRLVRAQERRSGTAA